MKKKFLYNLSRNLFHFIKRKIHFINQCNIKRYEKEGKLISLYDLDNYLNIAKPVIINSISKKNLRVGLVKPIENEDYKGYVNNRAYWTKYERFLKSNNYNYCFYNIHLSNWIEEADKFDIIIWHTYSSPDIQEEAETKIYFLEKFLKKKCFPSFDEIWSYENKVRASYLYKFFNLPAIPTFVSQNKLDAMDYINKTTFPIISKITTGSSSNDVIKLKNKKQALKYVDSCFSEIGRKTYWPYLRQKNYVYFQKFIEDATYDLRIIVIGNKVFGYYRYAKRGDFRASGAGIVDKKSLPEQAMLLAINAKKMLNSSTLAVDMLYSEKEQKFFIIETSIFIGVDTAEQLVVDGKPGYYVFDDSKTFTFNEGKFWIQELSLAEFFSNLN